MYQKNIFRSILWAGFLVGAADIVAAFLHYIIATGKNPERVLWFIASGVWGKDAYSGGLQMAVAGLLLHFLIAYAFTILFFFLYPRLNLGSKNKIVIGSLYGIFIWLVMNLIVVPLSNTQKFGFSIKQTAIGIFILIIAIGIPLSFIAGRFFSKEKPN
ncbi:MAG TPA: hypothetical protein VMI12_02455 [Puia sp.]|nr:hypothetical protein [Puia sp.]